MLGGSGSGASRFTGWIAIIGMAVGCFVLILSIAILNGFEERVTRKIIGFEGDIRISNRGELSDLESVIPIVVAQPGIRSVITFSSRTGILFNGQRVPRMVEIKAIDVEGIEQYYDFHLEESSLNSDLQDFYIGISLASRLNLSLDDKVVLVSPMDNMKFPSIGGRIQGRIKGIFQAGVLDFDDSRVFISQEAGRRLFTRNKGLDGIDIRLKENYDPDEFIDQITRSISKTTHIETWASMHSGLFSAMRMERIGAMIILSLIILVAAFNLTSTLVLVTYQKLREIGILRTLGATKKFIRLIIMKQGTMIGGIGAGVGTLSGLLIVFIQQKYGIFPLPEDIYMISQVPMVLYFRDIIFIPGVAFIMIIAASWIASKRAVKILPKDSLPLEK